jgi:hypothetical protein
MDFGALPEEKTVMDYGRKARAVISKPDRPTAPDEKWADQKGHGALF